jgi:hypothetical protein
LSQHSRCAYRYSSLSQPPSSPQNT